MTVNQRHFKALHQLATELGLRQSDASVNATETTTIPPLALLRNHIQFGNIEQVKQTFELCANLGVPLVDVRRMMRAFEPYYGPNWKLLCDEMDAKYPKRSKKTP